MKTAYAADCAYRTTVVIEDIIIPIYFFEANCPLHTTKTDKTI